MKLEEEIEIEITSEGAEGDHPILVLRRPSNKALKHFLSARFPRRGNKVEDNTTGAREAFIDAHLTGVKNLEVRSDAGYVPLGPVIPNWKEKIPLNWKTAAALRFEEGEVLTPEDEKNSAGSSA